MTKQKLSKTRLYSIYHGMKERCYNKNTQQYKYYGAKGITICDEWLNENGVQNFIEWSLNNGYNENLSIDRIDSKKGYSPDNCQWITQKMNSSRFYQFKNTSNGMKNKIKGVLGLHGYSFADYARYLKITPQALQTKFKKQTYKASDLIALAEMTDAKLAIIDNSGKPVITFSHEDIKKEAHTD